MPLFWAAIRRDWVSLLKSPFLNHVQAFTFVISFLCRLKYPYNCFSSNFCFLVIAVLLILDLIMLFLVAVINLSLFFFM